MLPSLLQDLGVVPSFDRDDEARGKAFLQTAEPDLLDTLSYVHTTPFPA